jgi:S-adenosylmethionine:tRNA ribosyltransferase-isomerase
MAKIPLIRMEDYDYPMEERYIAQYPSEIRDESRLLIVSGEKIKEARFKQIDQFLPADSILVFNNTKVIRARILFRKASGSVIEVFCLEPVYPTSETERAFSATSGVHWLVMAGNLKRWKSETLILQGEDAAQPFWFSAFPLEKKDDGTVLVRFEWEPSDKPFGEILEAVGKTPLPPYIKRSADDTDTGRYQTIFAQHEGSVAAPTAGLHFTTEVMSRLGEKNIQKQFVTLHVGAGTFRQVTVPDAHDHVMHQELIDIPKETIEALLTGYGKPVFAVGTTAARTLESLYWIGCRLFSDPERLPDEVPQWFPYQLEVSGQIPVPQALELLLTYLDRHGMSGYRGETRLMIVPGYRYRLLSGLITNFHVPRSTLLLLVAALTGDSWRGAYQYALDNGFRFLSYGDACLMFGTQENKF